MKRKIPKKKKKNDASKSCLLSLQRWCRVQQVLRCFQRRTYVSSLHLCFLAARRYSRDAVKRCLAAYLGPNAKSAAGAHAQVGQRDPPGRGQVKHFGKSWSAAADLAQISYLHATTDGRTTFKHSRSTVGRGTMHRIMVSGLHRDHRGVCRVRSIQGAAAAANARWSTSKRKKTEAQGAVPNLDGPHSHRIGVMGRWFSSTFWPFCSTVDK